MIESLEVGGLAAVINARLASDARIARAKGLLWASAGVASCLGLTGLGVACGLYGYALTRSIKPAAEEVATALIEALEHAELKTIVSGVMSLAPNSELKLVAGQTVGLSENASVRLDPNATVRAIGDLKLDIPQPSKQQLQVDTRARNEELPFTAYTIFRSVSLGGGEVVTGWNYSLSDMTRPKAQYCYYTHRIGSGVAAKYSLAYDGKAQPPTAAAKLPVAFDEAVASCIWFSGA